LKDGLLQQCDTPRALYDRPANSFVAGFIGSPAMNLKEVPLVSGGAQLGSLLVQLPREVLSAASSKGLSEVTLGVRPESFVITSDPNGLAMQVNLTEELGADAYVYGTTDLGDDQRFVVRADGRTPPKMGATVQLTVREAETHVFDPESGERLG
ncbi:MAG: sugar ABC transporter ATP-binding protein, partial [Pseudonocardiales bacterium]